jgi:hypothetical protein
MTRLLKRRRRRLVLQGKIPHLCNKSCILNYLFSMRVMCRINTIAPLADIVGYIPPAAAAARAAAVDAIMAAPPMSISQVVPVVTRRCGLLDPHPPTSTPLLATSSILIEDD